MAGSAYSYLDFLAAYDGPYGTFTMSSGGIAKEGITIAMAEDIATTVAGADGEWMNSLHASRMATFTIRLLKTSPLNRVLSRLYNFETRTAANYGQGTITGRNAALGDTFLLEGCGIRKFPDNVSAEDGGTNEWVFNVGRANVQLGDGRAVANGNVGA